MPTLIFLPGLHGTGELFAPLRAEIPPEFPVRLIQYPLDRPCRPAELLAQVSRELRDEGDLILLAESFSGPLALQFAADHPTRVRAVILCVSFVRPPVPRLLCYLATPLIWLRFPILNFAVRIFLSGFGAPHNVVTDAKREIRRVKPRVLAHRVRQAAHIDASAALKSCTAPILCLAAARDRLVGRRSIRRIRRIRPDIPIKVMDGPHLLLQVKPAEVWGEINGLLKTLELAMATGDGCR